MFLSAVYWFTCDLVLALTPALIAEPNRPFVAFVVAAIFASGALANFWATRGRHFGWMLLSVAVALALLGA